MKHLSTCIFLSTAIFAHAEQPAFDQFNAMSHGKKSAKQWGLDAVHIPKIVNPVNAEVIGLQPSDRAFFNKHLLIKAELPHLVTSKGEELRWHSEHTNFEDNSFASYQHFDSQNNTSRLTFGVAGNRFSAETNIAQSTWSQDNIASYQIQGAYKLYKQGNFSLALTAKFELRESSQFHQVFQSAQPALAINLNENQQMLNTTLGLVTTLNLTKNWQLFGTVSSHNIDDRVSDRLFIDDKHMQSATIATRYSF